MQLPPSSNKRSSVNTMGLSMPCKFRRHEGTTWICGQNWGPLELHSLIILKMKKNYIVHWPVVHMLKMFVLKKFPSSISPFQLHLATSLSSLTITHNNHSHFYNPHHHHPHHHLTGVNQRNNHCSLEPVHYVDRRNVLKLLSNTIVTTINLSFPDV